MKELPARITSLDPPQATEIRNEPHEDMFFTGKSECPDEGVDWAAFDRAVQRYKLSQMPMDIEIITDTYILEIIPGEDSIDMKTYDPGEGDYNYTEIRLNQSVRVVRTGKHKCKITKI